MPRHLIEAIVAANLQAVEPARGHHSTEAFVSAGRVIPRGRIDQSYYLGARPGSHRRSLRNVMRSSSMEGMARVGAVRRQAGPVDIVILTVIPPELEAARRALQIDDLGREKDSDGTVYFHGSVRSTLADRDYAVALGCIGGAGNPGAAAATAGAIARYHPRAVLLMGIAAGIRDKVRIGEVVLSDRVVAYEPAALIRSASGAHQQPRPEIDRAPHTMIQDVVSYRPEPPRLRATFDRAGGVLPAAPAGRGRSVRRSVRCGVRRGALAFAVLARGGCRHVRTGLGVAAPT